MEDSSFDSFSHPNPEKVSKYTNRYQQILESLGAFKIEDSQEQNQYYRDEAPHQHDQHHHRNREVNDILHEVIFRLKRRRNYYRVI